MSGAWQDVKAWDLKPGDRVRYRFASFSSEWRKATVVRLGDVTVKTDDGSICMKAYFQRRQEAASQWHDVVWDAIKVGDDVKCGAGPELKVGTIGDRYFEKVGGEGPSDLRFRYCSDVPPEENQWQRLEVRDSYRMQFDSCRYCKHSEWNAYRKRHCGIRGDYVRLDYVCDEYGGESK